MREYELMTVFRPDLDEAGLQQAVEKLNGAITTRGGEVTGNDLWGQRRLAYPIRDFKDGIYSVSKVQLDPSVAEDLERALRLNDQILRHMLVRLDEE